MIGGNPGRGEVCPWKFPPEHPRIMAPRDATPTLMMQFVMGGTSALNRCSVRAMAASKMSMGCNFACRSASIHQCVGARVVQMCAFTHNLPPASSCKHQKQQFCIHIHSHGFTCMRTFNSRKFTPIHSSFHCIPFIDCIWVHTNSRIIHVYEPSNSRRFT